jgi:hypothetical protein
MHVVDDLNIAAYIWHSSFSYIRNWQYQTRVKKSSTKVPNNQILLFLSIIIGFFICESSKSILPRIGSHVVYLSGVIRAKSRSIRDKFAAKTSLAVSSIVILVCSFDEGDIMGKYQ